MSKLVQILLKEYLNDVIEYSITSDGNGTEINALANGEGIGYALVSFLSDKEAFNLDFKQDLDWKEFKKLYGDQKIMAINVLRVEGEHQNYGVGKGLVKKALELANEAGVRQVYLNAAPMGPNGLRNSELIEFYKKLGFIELMKKGNGTIMGMIAPATSN